MSLELAQFNITVNSICPGAFETELFRKTRPKGCEEEQRILKNIPSNRFGEPIEIAYLISFLISPMASYITGQNIIIDGGLSLGI